MVPKEHWAAMFILASLMEPEFQMACDEHGFIWVRTCVCDVKRPNPSFKAEVEDPMTKEKSQITGDGNIDRNAANQWLLTTGLPLESIVMVRDHLGNCLDMSTMTMMEWRFLPPTHDEPETLNDLVQKKCVMPTCERWHCVLTERERATGTGLHLLDWQPYRKTWGDEYLSMRHADTNPPEKTLTLAEWVGSKVWEVAVISPTSPEEPQETLSGGIIHQA